MEARDRTVPPLAPLFHFFFAGGRTAIEIGLTISQAQGALLKKGMCGLAFHNFDISRPNVDRQPNSDAVRDGLRRRPVDLSTGTLFWKPISTIAATRTWKRHLASGAPLLIALQPNHTYLGLNATQPVLTNNDPPYSVTGHAAAVIGYSDADASFIVQDSRGTSFGINGQWFLPYDLCASPFIVLAVALVSEEAD
jgi:hypothetical protein